jgi:hypothetical protein
MRAAMSAIGTNGHSLLHRKCPLSGVKPACLFALRMSAYDPTRTYMHRLKTFRYAITSAHGSFSEVWLSHVDDAGRKLPLLRPH